MKERFHGASLRGKSSSVNLRSQAAAKDFCNGLLNSTPVFI
jgi:hypothetical protein